jgi:hypothetical protein
MFCSELQDFSCPGLVGRGQEQEQGGTVVKIRLSNVWLIPDCDKLFVHV